MIAAIYTRVSTDEQAQDGLSLAAQERQCRARADADGATEVRVYRDPGISGGTMDRPALARLLAELPALDVLYVADLDRLSRNELDQATLLRTFLSAEIGFVSLGDHVDITTADGRFLAGLKGLLSQREIEKGSERVQAAHAERLARGGYIGTIPLGYDIARQADGSPVSGSPLHVVPEEAALVRRIFDMYDPQGQGLSGERIAQLLNEEGIPGGGGGKWRSGRVCDFLRCSTYVGEVRVAGVVYNGAHEPIIGRAQWDRVQERLERRSNAHVSVRRGSFSALMSCGVCGGTVRYTFSYTRSGARYYRYACSERRLVTREERHPPVSISALKVDDALWAWVRLVFSRGMLQRMIRDRLEEAETTDGRADLRARLAEADAALRENVRLYDDHLITRELLEERNRPLVQRRADLQQQLRAWREPALDALRGLLELNKQDLESMIKTSSRERQLVFLQRLVEEVRIHPDNEVELQGALGLGTFRAMLPDYYAPGRGHAIESDLWVWER